MQCIFNFFAKLSPARTPEQLILRVARIRFGWHSKEAQLAKDNPNGFLSYGQRLISSWAHNIHSNERASIPIWQNALDDLRMHGLLQSPALFPRPQCVANSM